MSHATPTGNICNFSGRLVLLNTYDRRVLPFVGPLCDIFPWHRFITFIREGRRRLNYEGLETSGPLSSDVPGEVDHQRLGRIGFLSSDCMHASPSPFFALQTSIYPMFIIPCSSSSTIGHVSTLCDVPGCIKQESPLSPSRSIIPAVRNAFDTFPICFCPRDSHSSTAFTVEPL